MLGIRKKINQINLNVLEEAVRYDRCYICFLFDARVSNAGWAISHIFLDFILGNTNVLLVNHIVCLFTIEVGGSVVKLLKKSFFELSIKGQNDSLRDALRILILQQFDIKKITML